MRRVRSPHVPPACFRSLPRAKQSLSPAKTGTCRSPRGPLKVASAVGSALEAVFLRVVTLGQRGTFLSHSFFQSSQARWQT